MHFWCKFDNLILQCHYEKYFHRLTLLIYLALRGCFMVYNNKDIEEPITYNAVKNTGHPKISI